MDTPSEDNQEMASWREFRFPAIVALIAVGAVVLFRIYTGVGFGLDYSGESVTLGIVVNEHDNLQYLSWPMQAAGGAWLFDDRFTLDEHRPLFFHPLFVIVGRISQLIDVPSAGLLVLMGLMASFLTIVGMYSLPRRIGFSVRESRFACLTAAFGSGVTSLYGLLIPTIVGLFGGHPFQNAAYFCPTMIFPTVALAYPLITIANALTIGLVWLLFVWRDSDPRHVSLLWGAGIAGLVAFLGLTHLYEPLILTAVLIGGELILVLQSRVETPKRWWSMIGFVAVTTVAVASYHVWLGQQTVWIDVRRASLALPIPRRSWLLISGLMLPLGGYGAYRIWRERRKRAMFLVAWLALLVIALGIIGLPQSKLATCSHLPLALLSGIALAKLLGAPADRTGRARLLIGSCGLVLIAGTIGEYHYVAGKHFRCDGGLVALSEAIEADGKGKQINVLTDTQRARVLLALSPRSRVFAGNWFKTPDFTQRQEQLVRIGVEPPANGFTIDPETRRHELEQFLKDFHFDFALLHRQSPAAKQIAADKLGEVVAAQGKRVLIRLHD